LTRTVTVIQDNNAMNEKEIKSTYISSIHSDHIQDSIFPSALSEEAAAPNKDIEIRIKDEVFSML
jgi:hypothetical protein